MDSKQATIMVQILERATEGNWPDIAEHMTSEEVGYSAAEVIDAWRALEKVAHMQGTAPEACDF